MHEKTADDTWPAVHVLIVAPCCKVDVPIVELERHIANRVSQVPADRNTIRMAVACYELNIEELPRIELYTGQEDKGGRGGVF